MQTNCLQSILKEKLLNIQMMIIQLHGATFSVKYVVDKEQD